MLENGLNPADLLGRRFGHHLDFWGLSQGRLIQRVDLGDEHQMVLKPRPAHHPEKTWGFVGLALGLLDQALALQPGEQGIEDPLVDQPLARQPGRQAPLELIRVAWPLEQQAEDHMSQRHGPILAVCAIRDSLMGAARDQPSLLRPRVRCGLMPHTDVKSQRTSHRAVLHRGLHERRSARGVERSAADEPERFARQGDPDMPAAMVD